jgi:uncharacterized membrane protein YtjA (UPF0391 family)
MLKAPCKRPEAAHNALGKLAHALQSTALENRPHNVAVEDERMLYWAAVFFVIALAAAFFGFGGIAASAAGIAKILFFVFLVLAVVSLIFGRRTPI